MDYIDRLLEEVIQSGDLPPTLINAAIPDGNERYNLNEIVRPTRSAAIALRAKLWVYAASPLFNGGYAEALEVKTMMENICFLLMIRKMEDSQEAPRRGTGRCGSLWIQIVQGLPNRWLHRCRPFCL